MIKKAISLMLSAIMALTFTSITVTADNAELMSISGSGTQSDPYLISNAEEFKLIRDFPSSHFKLTQNIVLSGNFSSVGTFSGTIDGNGFMAVGIKSSGMIYNNKGTIKNLIVEMYDNTYPLIYDNKGTVENVCIVNGTVSSYGNGATFALTNNGIIKNCASSTQLTVTGSYGSSSSVGGFVGKNNGKIENCLYTGHIYCKGTTANGDKLYAYVSPFVGDNAKASSEYIDDGGTVKSSFYYKDETTQAGKSSGGASGKSNLALTMQATYSGWDFENTWAIDSSKNDGYPYLQIDRRFKEPDPTPTPTPTPSPTTAPTATPTITPTTSPTATPGGISVIVGTVKGAQGSTVNVPVVLSGNSGFINLGIEISYDSNALTLKEVNNNISVGGLYTSSQTLAVNPYVMVWDSSTNNNTYNGQLAILTFEINPSAQDGDYTVGVSYYKGRNGDYTDGVGVNYSDSGSLNLSYVNGAVKAAKFTPYDINGDGIVDNRDGTTLLRYLAGWSDDNITYVEAALDTNNDGKVDNRDGTYLLRYLAGWDQ